MFKRVSMILMLSMAFPLAIPSTFIEGFASQKTEKATASLADAQVRVITPRGLPIQIDYAAVERKRDSALLRYRVKNESDEYIKGGRATLTFYRGTTARGTWYQLGSEWDIAPHSTLDQVEEIGKEIAQDELLLMVLLEVQSEKNLWRVDRLKLKDAIKNCLLGKPYTLPGAEWWEVVKKVTPTVQLR